jgi:hypothetical protein
MRGRLSTDFLTGVLFLVLGGFVLIYGSRYAMGSSVRMGPGYFPRMVSTGLVLLGLVLVIKALVRGGEAIQGIALRPLLLVLAGTLAFGFLIERAGFWLASVLLVVVSRFADRGFRIVEVGALALFLTALITVIFRYGLGLSLRLVPF